MFKKNINHLQTDLFPFMNELSPAERKMLLQSEEFHFYNIVFKNIKEEEFSCLYSEKYSRSNSPINLLVGALILKEKRDWSYAELFDNLYFNLKVKTALGLPTISATTFCYTTIFNFQNRIADYYAKTGINLIEKVFDQLTDLQLKELKLKTDIQRIDSFLAGSNVRKYSRLSLLIEVLIRFYRVLTEEDQSLFKAEFDPYIKESSSQYIYKLKKSQLPHQFETVGRLYALLLDRFRANYKDIEVFKIMERVFGEHYIFEKTELVVIPNESLSSSNIQTPDDLDATYRKKRDIQSIGQAVTVTETANPENDIQLVTDITCNPNNINDSEVINERIALIKEKTPDLSELHTDGGFGSEENDKKFAEFGIRHVQTAIVGRQPFVEMKIDQTSSGTYLVRCPLQSVESISTSTRYKASFNVEICKGCPNKDKCPAQKQSKKGVLYFTEQDYLLSKRKRNIQELPIERRKLRPNVEATVKEFSYILSNRKLKVRGGFKAAKVNILRGIGVNFGRIYRYIYNNEENCAQSAA